jgi:hypothetical protein
MNAVIDYRSQSYDRKLERQGCKNWQRNEEPSAYRKQKYFLLTWKNALAYYNASVVAVSGARHREN